MRIKVLSPFWLPVWFFSGAILTGAAALHSAPSLAKAPLGWIDSLFTATSAMCVTGLVVVDTGTFFTRFGQSVILMLIQFGGLGIMTYTSLAMHLLGRKISLTDRIAVGQSLLHDPTFSLFRFAKRVVFGTLILELVGALLLYWRDPVGFAPYSALFHSISAFCNAGFSLYADSLTAWRGDVGVNSVIMILIVLGGLGFAVLYECSSLVKSMFLPERRKRLFGRAHLLSWHSQVVLETTLFLIVGGTVVIFFSEWLHGYSFENWHTQLLSAMFSSVTCRTAGFNTVDVAGLTNVSLVFMMCLMFIGGSPGSTAGGIKTTTFRAWWSFVVAQVKGRRQQRVGRYALTFSSTNRALTLIVFSVLFVAAAALVLNVTESGGIPHSQARTQFLDILFEVISAFGTVGLSTGLTPTLTPAGKIVVIILMFVGRLGPIWLLTALQSWQMEPHYRIPEDDLPLG